MLDSSHLLVLAPEWSRSVELLYLSDFNFTWNSILLKYSSVYSYSVVYLKTSSGCLVHMRRFSAGKQGARGVVGRMQNADPTMPRAPSYNKEGRLGTRHLQVAPL